MPPYWPWLMLLLAIVVFGVVLQLGLEDGLDDFNAGEQRAMRWRAAALAYLMGVVASVTYVASVWLLERLDRAVV